MTLDHARRERPDLIRLDVIMPKLQGFEGLTHLKADPQVAALCVAWSF